VIQVELPPERPERRSAARARSRAYKSQRQSQDEHTKAQLQKLGQQGKMGGLSQNGLSEGTLRARCFAMLAHPMFDMFISMVIVLNSITIGVELTVQPSEESETPETKLAFGIVENVFLIIYTAELACRFYACGKSCLRSSWVKLDVCIVIIGIIGNWLVPIFILVAGDAISKPSFLSIFRLARIGRAVRLFVQFRVLWMLIRGIFSSMPTIMNVFIVFLLVIFAFACVGVEIITNNAKSSQGGEFQDLVHQYWSTLPRIMLTLVQFVTLDSAAGIYAPMIHDEAWLLLYFIPFLLVVAVVLMNLVVAVVLEGFMESAKRDQEARRLLNEERLEKLMPRLRTIFAELDSDGSGQITLDEVESAPLELQNELEALLDGCSLPDLFEALDEDGSMEISIDEFLDGMTKITGGRSLEMTRILKLQTLTLAELKQTYETRCALLAAEKQEPRASRGSAVASHNSASSSPRSRE